MVWNCPLCTYQNSSDIEICEMCEQELRPFSINSSEENLLKHDSEVQYCEQISNQNAFGKRKDIYVRVDGQLLFNEQARDERKRAIARRKALDLHKLRQNFVCQSNEKNDTSMTKKESESRSHPASASAKPNLSSEFSINTRNASAVGVSTTAFASKSKGHATALNAHAKGVNASASATADCFTASALNANATGANVSASASATAARVTTLNANVTGTNVSANANADGISVAAGNVGITEVDVAASASASTAKVQVGNIDMNGGSVGASVKVNGCGITAGNVSIGGASAAASVNIDGSLSFGNINIGLRPSLDIGFGLNFGIPFLSGSKMGSQGNANGEQTEGQGQNAGRLEQLQEYLSSKYPNQRIYKTPVNVSIRRNNDGQAIDPLIPDISGEQADVDNSAVNDVIERHNQLVTDKMKFVGFKGCPPQSSTTNLPSTQGSSETSTSNGSSGSTVTTSTSDPIWQGMYTSPNPDVAAGYTMSNDGRRTGDIKRVYLPSDAGNLYYTKTGLETPEARVALEKVKEHSNDKYIFGGPQDSKNPDLFAPETIISPSVRDKAKADGTLRFEASAHEVDSSSRPEQFHRDELEHSKMTPDYLVNIKTAADCAKAGGRERLAHVFQGQPSSGHYGDSTKQPEINEDDKLLLEECAKLGDDITFAELSDWKKKLKSDSEYERDEDLSTGLINENANMNTSHQNETSKTTDNEEIVTEPSEPCKDHSNKIRCMKCMQGSSGPRIRKVHGRIHGFDFKKEN